MRRSYRLGPFFLISSIQKYCVVASVPSVSPTATTYLLSSPAFLTTPPIPIAPSLVPLLPSSGCHSCSSHPCPSPLLRPCPSLPSVSYRPRPVPRIPDPSRNVRPDPRIPEPRNVRPVPGIPKPRNVRPVPHIPKPHIVRPVPHIPKPRIVRPVPRMPELHIVRPLPRVPDVPVLHLLSVSPGSQIYHWKNIVKAIAVVSVAGFILLVMKDKDYTQLPLLSSLVTVLLPGLYPLVSSQSTQPDLSSDKHFYKTSICRVFGIQFEEVIDLTGHINRSRYIAAGGSGEVWEASWIHPKSFLRRRPEALPRVAVKLIRLPALMDEKQKAKRYKRMKRELRLWSKLNHPHILPLIGIARIESDANLPAFISPWMENGNVMEFLRKDHSFPASKFLTDIIKGLHYLHTFNPVIVHGDIKGANVLIDHRKEAYLSDFGLSHMALHNTLWRTTATHANGTLRWMAPELINEDMIAPTIESDIYAFAITCYEILSRKSPYPVMNDPAVILKVIEGHRPERIESCHSDEIWSIITRCWEHDPANRPSSEETLGLILQLDTTH